MIHLITGGSGSGKSAYAENELLRVGELQTDAGRCPYVYAATMRPYGEETMRKIMRHRQMRAGKGFVTLECPSGLSGVALPENRGVLLECVSNLAANELFCEDGTIKDAKETAEKIIEGIRCISRQTENLVIVTNEVNADAECYSEETERYIFLVGKVNQEIARMADRVTEVVYGIPVQVKIR